MALLFYFKFYLNLAMAFYWIKTNRLIKRVFSKYVWEIPNSEKIVYLTFDDGPTPDIILTVTGVILLSKFIMPKLLFSALEITSKNIPISSKQYFKTDMQLAITPSIISMVGKPKPLHI